MATSLLLGSVAAAQDDQDNTHARPEPVLVVAQGKIEGAKAKPYPGETISLFTPRQDGIFRVSYYLEAPSSATGTACVFIRYTDSEALRIVGGNCAGKAAAATYAPGSVVIHAKAGMPITYNPFLANNNPPGEVTFNFFITVEQLGCP